MTSLSYSTFENTSTHILFNKTYDRSYLRTNILILSSTCLCLFASGSPWRPHSNPSSPPEPMEPPIQPLRAGVIPPHRLSLTICGLAELPNAREKCRTPMTVRTLQDEEIALPLHRGCLSVVLYLFQTKAAPDREAVDIEHDYYVQPIRNANYSSLLAKCFLYGL